MTATSAPTLESVDVVVLGSGGAGLLAAQEAASRGRKVVLLSKGQVGRSGATATITGDVSVDGRSQRQIGMKGDLRDSVEAFYEDTLEGGSYLNHPKLVETMVCEVGAEMGKLVAAGLKIVGLGHAPGHRSARGVLVSGMQVLQILVRQAAAAGVLFRDEFYASELLMDEGRAVGVAGIDLRTGEVTGVLATSVVIATGGGAMVYPIRTAPQELVGDGYRMALEAGAELLDMEMVQFLPCCLIEPPLWRGVQFPWILGPQSGTRAWLLNRHGERFMARYDPDRMEMSTRDRLSIACVREVLEGRGGPRGGVFMSWAHLPSDILEFLPEWYGKPLLHSGWRWEGFDFGPLVQRIQAGRAVEVAPASHFHMGGIRIDEFGATRVPGLFACGEVAGGAHGANRLSGNACSQFLVQGRRAGMVAARFATGVRPTLRRENWKRAAAAIEGPLAHTSDSAPHEVLEGLQCIAQTALNAVREGAALEMALTRVRKLVRDEIPRVGVGAASRTPYNRAWIDALELRSAARTVEAITLAALCRRESRGAHYRADYPDSLDVCRRNLVLNLCASELACADTAVQERVVP